ncbi:MAG TPA: response regulator transcription factor [Thermoanaerobaculia bacterium]|nr:response regulator transcription factor [Thermoanaerobaculia bacterium]
MTRILLVDDHVVVRQGLRQILKESIADAVFGDAASGEEAVRLARAAVWDVVLLDISLPGKSGLDVLKELRQSRPNLPILVLSMHPEDQFAVHALRAGAAGYVTKKTAAADLVTAVKTVLAGRKYVSSSLGERLAGQVGLAPGTAPHELLSDREFQVFRLLASGKTVTAIAEALHLSVPTVSTYRARILEKMLLTENSDLVQYAIVHRIFD